MPKKNKRRQLAPTMLHHLNMRALNQIVPQELIQNIELSVQSNSMQYTIIVSKFHKNNHDFILLPPINDQIIPKKLASIPDIQSTLAALKQHPSFIGLGETFKKYQVIIPLGLAVRRHWVTLHLQHETNEIVATLYDSKSKMSYLINEIRHFTKEPLPKILSQIFNKTPNIQYLRHQSFLNNVDCGRFTHFYIQALIQGKKPVNALFIDDTMLKEIDQQLGQHFEQADTEVTLEEIESFSSSSDDESFESLSLEEARSSSMLDETNTATSSKPYLSTNPILHAISLGQKFFKKKEKLSRETSMGENNSNSPLSNRLLSKLEF